MGIQRQNVELTSHQYRLWDAENVDTRFPNMVILSPALNVCTIVPSRGDLNHWLDYQGTLYFVEANSVASANTNVFQAIGNAYNFVAPLTIGSVIKIADTRDVTSAIGVGSINFIHARGERLALSFWGVSDDGGFNYYGNPNVLGGSLTAIPNLPQLTGGNILFERMGVAIDMGGTLHFMSRLSGGSDVFFLTNNIFGAPTLIASYAIPVGSYLARPVTDGLTVYAQTPDTIWDFDAIPIEAISTRISQDKNPVMTLFKNELYFKNKNSLIRYDGENLSNVGYDREDGLPLDKMGEITAMVSSYKWLFAAVKGATYSHILAMDDRYHWHGYARVPSPGIWVRDMFLSDSPDGYNRLWLLFDNAVYPAYFLNPLVNPLQAATYSYVPTGHFTPSFFDGGMPEISGVFLATSVAAAGFSPSERSVQVQFGINNQSETNGVLGSLDSSNPVGSLVFGNPYGLEGRRLNQRFTLWSHLTGTTIIFYSALTHYLKIPNTRESFLFTVDLLKTSRDRGNSLESVLGTLNAIRDRKTLVPFWYGHLGTKSVKVMDMASREETEDSFWGQEREGKLSIKVSEVL